MEKTPEKQTETSKKKHQIKLMPTQQIILRYDDGSEIAFRPQIINGSVVMNPVEIVSDPTEEEKQEEEKEHEKEPVKSPKKIEPKRIPLYKQKPVPKETVVEQKSMNFTKYMPQNTSKYVNLGYLQYGRKHLIVDHETMIQPREFKRQMIDFSDTIAKPDFGPRTKKELKRLHSTSGIVKLFALPAHMMLVDKLRRYYIRHCVTSHQPVEEEITDLPLLPLVGSKQVNNDKHQTKQVSYTKQKKYPPAQCQNVTIESEETTSSTIKQEESLDHSYSSVEKQQDEAMLVIDESEAKQDEDYQEISIECSEDDTIDEDEELTICDDSNYVDENGEPVVFLKGKNGRTLLIKKSNLIVM